MLQVESFSFQGSFMPMHTPSLSILTGIWMFNLHEPFKLCSIFGNWPQASKQTCIHMHMRNAVPLVWGSLRLALLLFKVHWWLQTQSNVGDLCWGHLQLIIAAEHGRCGCGVCKWREQYWPYSIVHVAVLEGKVFVWESGVICCKWGDLGWFGLLILKLDIQSLTVNITL